jgi:O-antigen ligase
MSKLFFWVINLLIFLLPAYLFRFKIAGLSTNFFEICFLFIFIWWIIEKRYKGRKKSKDDFMLIFRQFINRDRLLSFGISLLLIGASLSTVFSLDARMGLGILKSWFIIPIIFAFIIIDSQISRFANAKQKIYILKSLAISGATVSIISIFYLILGITTYDGRLRAFFEHSNHLAMCLAPCFLIVVGHLLSQIKSQKNKIFWFISLFIISIPLYFTYSYGAWMGIIAGTLLILWRHLKISGNKKEYGKRKKKLYYYIIILLIVVIGLVQLSQPKLQNIFITQRSSFHSRLMIWRSAFHVLEDNWFLGIGPGMFQEYYLDYQKYFSPYLEWAVPQPHNIFLAFWLQTGIIGFTGFILILVWFFRTGLKSIHKISKNKKEALTAYGSYGLYVSVLMAIMIYFLVHGIVDTLYWKNDLSVVFWVIIALMSIVSRPNYLQRKESPPCQK